MISKILFQTVSVIFSTGWRNKSNSDLSVDSPLVIRLVFAIYFEWMDIVGVYEHFFVET